MPAQIIVPERHGDHPRLAAYKLAASRVWDEEWSRYAPAAVREVMEYYRRFPVIWPALRRHLPRDGEVLEAGSGLGHFVALLAEAGFAARGVDTSPEALARARAAFPALRFEEADVLALPHADASFAGYVSFGVAEHFREGPHQLLREAARVLRDGGVLVLSVPWLSPLRRAQRLRPPVAPEGSTFYQYFFSSKELIEAARECSFSPRALYRYGTLKTLRDELRALRWGRRVPAEPAAEGNRPARRWGTPRGLASERVGLGRRLRWAAQNLLLENPLLHRLAAHMILLVAERRPRSAEASGAR